MSDTKPITPEDLKLIDNQRHLAIELWPEVRARIAELERDLRTAIDCYDNDVTGEYDKRIAEIEARLGAKE